MRDRPGMSDKVGRGSVNYLVPAQERSVLEQVSVGHWEEGKVVV